MNRIEIELFGGKTLTLTEHDAEEVAEALNRLHLKRELEYRLWGRDNGVDTGEGPYDERSAEVAGLVKQGRVDPDSIVEKALSILWDTGWETSPCTAFETALEEARANALKTVG